MTPQTSSVTLTASMPFTDLVKFTYPEYRNRHIFTAKLRLVIFLVFWLGYVIFLKDWLEETRSVVLIVSACFLVTTICYYNIFNNRLVKLSFLGETLADVVSLTAVVYLTGGPASSYFTVYIFYAVAAGMFYNHVVAALAAGFSIVSYLVFTYLSHKNVISPMLVTMDGMMSPTVLSPWFHPALLVFFLIFAVYVTKIAHYFTQVRERMLEERNNELTALHMMGSTIRSVLPLKDVIDQVLEGVLSGLGFSAAVLILFDKEIKKIKCYAPSGNPNIKKVEDILKFSLGDLTLPLDALDRSALRALRQNQIIFRRRLDELTVGLEPAITQEKSNLIQEALGVKRVVAIPLVMGHEVTGAILGFTTEPFVPEKVVEKLEAFGNQAALAVETSTLIGELKKKNVLLEEANRVKSQFLATMGHELRTPLTAIIGFSELLLEGVMGELTDEQKESVREVINNGADLLDMINNLLDLAKIDSGKIELKCHAFNLGQLIDRIHHTITPLVRRRGHQLNLDVPSDLPQIGADEKRLQQVLLNLLSNAIKFTPDGGSISVLARYYPSPEAANRDGIARPLNDLSLANGLFYIRVKDTGIGIKEEHLESIFEMFGQVDSSITRGYEGTGLGLALSKQLVELHRGIIWAESELGKGAEFKIALPAVVQG